MDSSFLRLIEEIDRKREEIKCSNSGAFFRGHSDGTFTLIPSLLRIPLRPDTEHNLYHEFYARAHNQIARDASSWERLAFLQHHGVPTRLLDWTESLGVAMFFASQGKCSGAHIWIANAFRLNKSTETTSQPRILMAGLDQFPDYQEAFVRVDDPRPWPYKKPIFMQIPWTTDRLRAQSGFFTFHPSAEPFDKVGAKYLRRVEIPTDALPGIAKFLQIAGITAHTVFPDFVGLSSFLKTRYRV
jgi:hypothetical protein